MSKIVELRQSDADRYENVHDWLRQELELPEWYGDNLDALWDCITGDLPLPLKIIWIRDSDREQHYAGIVQVFADAAEQYEEISFEYNSVK
ncbi:barstar family protein [Paenibacillus sp. GCM10012307]|uniref:Barstar family protein n=1 Tax=Paenibacillus roseus TaxID=2798579 RepID=A0A934J3D3_9BACL|nr:barstar family protein [Paenibacillus roseus]MBJ6360738.1 barstar family protein [Paenibacillus roseus]